MAKKQKHDPAMAKVREIFADSGLSLVDLGRRMGYPEETARQSAWQFMQSNDPRIGMLRKFADAMGVSLSSLMPKGKRMSRKLEDELKDAGCTIGADEFRDLLDEKKAVMYPAWSYDELTQHPRDAIQYCDQIRADAKCPKLDDFLILRTLVNVRKAH